MNDAPVSCAHFHELNRETLYDLLRLRSEVFVVEQRCPYLELDGRDTEPDTVHVWISDHDKIVSTLRLLRDPDGTGRIGRVCTAQSSRGRGLAEKMVRFVCDRYPEQIVLLAQTYLLKWYESLGFVRDGEELIEDGIPHTPMRLVR